jgi:hypothetical protein
MASTPSLQAALEELDVARFVGDQKRIAAAKAAVARAKQAALPACEQRDEANAEAFIRWRTLQKAQA